MKTLVIIPTYNEIENITAIIDAVMKQSEAIHILVIDDNSPDGTASAVKKHMANYPGRLFIEERAGKMGLGTAYILGFNWGIAHSYDYIMEMDADFSHNPNDVPRLIKACHEDGADMAVGSRYITGVNVVNWPMGRVLMSYCASIYVRLITGMKLYDTTAGFVCYRRNVLENIGLNKIEFKGYAFQIEMKYRAWRKGFKVVEIPIVFVNRVLGTSKMSGSIFGEAAFGVIKLRIKSIFGKL
jgi:dolichol-phosphate mannosyltransferase